MNKTLSDETKFNLLTLGMFLAGLAIFALAALL